MRFSIVTLLGLVAFAAFGCSGLLFASPVWVGIVFTMVAVSLLTSYLGILLLRKGPQAFSIGFALFGTLYLLACLLPQTGKMTSPAFEQLHKAVRREAKPVQAAPVAAGTGYGAGYSGGSPMMYAPSMMSTPGVSYEPSQTDFLRFGQMLSVLLVAVIGGFVARYFYGLRQKQEAGIAEQSK